MSSLLKSGNPPSPACCPEARYLAACLPALFFLPCFADAACESLARSRVLRGARPGVWQPRPQQGASARSRSGARCWLSSSAPRLLLGVLRCRLELLPEPPAPQGSLALGRMVLTLRTPSRSRAREGEDASACTPLFPPHPITSNFCGMKTKRVFCRHVPTFLPLF